MIDLFGIADDSLGAVNPMISATIRTSTGTQTNADYTTTPTFQDFAVMIDVQALSTGDLQHLDNISQQDDVRAVYVRGVRHALNRPLQTGGDILVFDGSSWLITHVLEEWGGSDWCKVAVTRQIPPA